MGFQPPTAGELRQRVRFERRGAADDGYGNQVGAWAALGAPSPERAAKLIPTRGGEQVIASRLTGESSWDLWVRFEAVSADVKPEDRAIDVRTGQVFAIRWAQDFDGRRKWILMQLQTGVADG